MWPGAGLSSEGLTLIVSPFRAQTSSGPKARLINGFELNGMVIEAWSSGSPVCPVRASRPWLDALETNLFSRHMQVYVLDGDNIRHGLNSNLGFSPEDRVENIRRVAEVAKLMADAGLMVITSFISPYRLDRTRARKVILSDDVEFIEVHVAAPLHVCERRDPKKLYKRARSGEIKDFTGIDAPYEEPENPEITIHTDRESVKESVGRLLDFLIPRLQLDVAEYEI